MERVRVQGLSYVVLRLLLAVTVQSSCVLEAVQSPLTMDCPSLCNFVSDTVRPNPPKIAQEVREDGMEWQRGRPEDAQVQGA